MKFYWYKRKEKETIKGVVTVNSLDELCKIIKNNLPATTPDVKKEDIRFCYYHYNDKLMHDQYYVEVKNHGVIGYASGEFEFCEICKKDYEYENSNSKFPRKCCSEACEMKFRELNRKKLDDLKISEIKVESSGDSKKDIFFKIDEISLIYKMEIIKKDKNWTLYSKLPQHPMSQYERACPFCQTSSNYCIALKDCADELFEKLKITAPVRLELLF